MKFYTGIGSRKTPIDIKTLIINITKTLANNSYILRSGGADGANLFFEETRKKFM